MQMGLVLLRKAARRAGVMYVCTVYRNNHIESPGYPAVPWG